jgi:hypothetical protein
MSFAPNLVHLSNEALATEGIFVLVEVLGQLMCRTYEPAMLDPDGGAGVGTTHGGKSAPRAIGDLKAAQLKGVAVIC